ncbi:hypothetical protein JCM10207_006338 [Rhodosporidiobolus poonsookiae]
MAKTTVVREGTKKRKSSLKAEALGLNWNDFLADEYQRQKEEHPKMKHRQLQKKCGEAFQKLKREKAAELADQEENDEGEGEGEGGAVA